MAILFSHVLALTQPGYTPSCSKVSLVATGQFSGAGVQRFSGDLLGRCPALVLVRVCEI